MKTRGNVSWIAIAGLLAGGCIGGVGSGDPALADGGSGGTAAGDDTTGGGETVTPDSDAGDGAEGSGNADDLPDPDGDTGTMDDEGTSGDPGDTGGSSSGDDGPAPECLIDDDCELGTLCDADGTCQPGCSTAHGCPGTDTCCDGQCVDTDTDDTYCGACDTPCVGPANQAASCMGGMCIPGDCDDGYFDCDGQGTTGCEADASCLCVPGTVQSCYPFAAATEGVGPCTAGSQTCNAAGTGYSACSGFVGPVAEICANAIDDDCNGPVDDIIDVDGDGWTICDNDCCETTFDCGDPELVNPGAFEYVGNGVDDDCDAATSDAIVAPACSSVADFSALTAGQLAQAMDICQTTTTNPPLWNRKWGLLNAELRLADGTAPGGAELSTIQNSQTAVLTNYGTGGIVPFVLPSGASNPTMAGLSSGWMRDQNDPGWPGSVGTSFGYYTSQPPAVYLAAHAGALPASAGCSGVCPSGSGANDSVNLRLTVRVPTNAQSFRYRLRFVSAEYWTYACTQFNDFYLSLLQTTAAGIPADRNIAFDSLSNPLSVNNGFFDICVANGCYTCPSGAGALAGTGMQVGNTGGATEWLENYAPVTPGEDMVLELMIFDVSDDWLDSLVLLDGFEWDIDPSGVGIDPQG